MKKIIITLIALFILAGCAGPLWEGYKEESENRGSGSGTVNITITLFENDPLWEYIIAQNGEDQ